MLYSKYEGMNLPELFKNDEKGNFTKNSNGIRI